MPKRVFSLLAASALAGALSLACGDGPDPTPFPTPRLEATVQQDTPTPDPNATPSPEVSPTPGTPKPETTPIVLTGATPTASGLQVKDIVVGSGAQPTRAQTVVVHYSGYLAATGEKFDSSLDRGQPATFAVSGVIPGFQEALLGMKQGGKRQVIIPAALGYGPNGISGVIPPNADLYFDIELIAVR
jgi:hypothetical protein